METKEAIEKLRWAEAVYTNAYKNTSADNSMHEAFAMAINALEIVAEMDSCESCKIEPVYEITLERA